MLLAKHIRRLEMKVLLTNDDGYTAKGIRALARAVADRGHDVVIVAPERQRSAASHAVTLHKPLRLKRDENAEEDRIEVYYTSGTPADSAMLGVLEVAPDCDIIISGINSGPNLGEDTIYSGTVAAAVEGALIGKRAISVSLADFLFDDYELAAAFTAGLAQQFVKMNLPSGVVINVNVPPIGIDEYKGFLIAPLGTRKYKDVLQKRTDPRGQEFFWIAGDIIRNHSEVGTDNAAIADGMISITPLVLNLTAFEQLEMMKFDDPLQ